jgi:hypothetical protein
MLPQSSQANGCMFVNYKDEICFCSHKMSLHLDRFDVCLSPKCICDSFRNEQTLSTKEDQSKIGEKKKQQAAKTKEKVDPLVGDPHIFDYIYQLSRM